MQPVMGRHETRDAAHATSGSLTHARERHVIGRCRQPWPVGVKILLEIGDVDRVESYVSDALSKKKKIMGFGHAVYKTEDPRATHLRRFSKEMGERKGDSKWYEITAKLEAIMKREKNLLPNVDAYSASTYYMMGIPLDLYTPIFAISRISGWTAHILEQYADNKLIRPRAEYVGPRNVPYVPIDER